MIHQLYWDIQLSGVNDSSEVMAEEEVDYSATVEQSMDDQPRPGKISEKSIYAPDDRWLRDFAGDELKSWKVEIEDINTRIRTANRKIQQSVDEVLLREQPPIAKRRNKPYLEEHAYLQEFDVKDRVLVIGDVCRIPQSIAEAVQSTPSTVYPNYIYEDRSADQGGNMCTICKVDTASRFAPPSKCDHALCNTRDQIHTCKSLYLCTACAHQVYGSFQSRCPICKGCLCPLYPFQSISWTFIGEETQKTHKRMLQAEADVVALKRKVKELEGRHRSVPKRHKK